MISVGKGFQGVVLCRIVFMQFCVMDGLWLFFFGVMGYRYFVRWLSFTSDVCAAL